MTENAIDELTEKVIGCAFTVHNEVGSGFLEKVYENSLLIELRDQGVQASQQVSLPVHYKEQLVGEFFADLLVSEELIVELKAVQDLAKVHEVQLVNYLNAAGKDVGLLINFGESVQVRRKYRVYTAKK
jgi:GxxExxY protein